MDSQLENNRQYYDTFANSYERHRHAGYHALIDELELSVILPYATGTDVLEAGCGTGLVLKEVAGVARSARGLDLSPGMLEQARARGLDVVQGSVTELPFADASFDLVYSVKVLAHVEQIERALAEMARVTRPGGHIIAEFYNTRSLRYLVKRLKPPTKIAEQTTDESVFTRYDSLEDIKRYLPSSLAFVDVRGVRVFTPVSHVHRVPILAPLFRRLENYAVDAQVIRHLAGFLMVITNKR